jgi:uncharacterized protein YcbX
MEKWDQTRAGTLVELWRYPVKSMAGEQREAVTLDCRGIPGDRGWAIFDEERKGVTGAKRLPSARACQARYVTEPTIEDASPEVQVTLPDGRAFATSAADANTNISEFFGRPVSFLPLGPLGSESAPRLTLQGESEETVRALHALAPGEPLPDYSELPPERLRALRQGNFFDAFPLHLLTRTSLRTLASITPGSRWDPRRFRMNMLIDCASPERFPEQSWVGRRLRVGSAVIEVMMGCPRCVVVTQPVDDLPQDRDIMRTLVLETHHLAGVYANVVEPGIAQVGDQVELL